MFLKNPTTQQMEWSSTRQNPLGDPPGPEVQFSTEKLHNLSTQFFGVDNVLEDIPHQHEEGGTSDIDEDEQIPSHKPGLTPDITSTPSTKKETADAVVVDTDFDKWCKYQHANCSLNPEVRSKFLSILTKHDEESTTTAAVSKKK